MSQALSMAIMLLRICTQSPEAIQACMTDQHIWLWPEIRRGVELYLGHEIPYSSEHGKLEAWQNAHPKQLSKQSAAS